MPKLSFNKRLIKRLFKRRRVDPTTKCWIWTAQNKVGGYGRLTIDGIRTQAHRFSAYLWLGYDLKSNLLVLHKNECNNPSCFNPDHLYIGDHKQNSLDAKNAGHLSTGYCNKGHRIDSRYRDKDRMYGIRLYCRTCRVERVRRWRERKLLTQGDTP